MDRTLLTLFNDGDNNGTIIIVSTDFVEIRCHKLIITSQSQYFAETIRSERETKRQKIQLTEPLGKIDVSMNPNGKITRIELAASVVVICQAVHLLYNSQHEINPSLTVTEYVALFDLIDDLQFVHNTKKIKEKILCLFDRKLTKENWVGLLKELYPNKKPFVDVIVSFYKKIIPHLSEFISADPLRELDMNSPLGKYMGEVYRSWLDYYLKKDKIIHPV